MVRRVTRIRAMDEFGEVVPLVGIRVRVERVGAQLIFQFVIQAVVIAILDGYDGRRGARPESGLSVYGEEARKQEERA
jgi:hypothetical protein